MGDANNREESSDVNAGGAVNRGTEAATVERASTSRVVAAAPRSAGMATHPLNTMAVIAAKAANPG
jgi:hypothetical protein